MTVNSKLLKPIKDFGWNTCINMIIVLVFWGGMLRRSFNADTITFMVSEEFVQTNLKSGRYVQSLFDYIYSLLGIKTTSFQSITTLMALAFFAMAITVLQYIFLKWKKQGTYETILYYIGTGLVFLNVLFVELLMFGECCIHFGFGYFCASLSAFFYTKKKWIKSFFFLMIAVCTYQLTVIYVAIILAFYLCLSDEFRLGWSLVIREFVAVCYCLLFGAINLISVKLVVALGLVSNFSKSVYTGSILSRFGQVGGLIKDFLKDNYNIFPDLWIPLLFILFLIAVFVWQVIRDKVYYQLLTFAILVMGSTFLLFIIPLMNNGDTLYYPSRMSFCFYLLLGLMILAVGSISRGKMVRILSLGSICFLMFQLIFCHFIIGDRMVTNNLDEVYIDQFYASIEKYEASTGITVQNICVVHDIDAPFYYDNISFYSNQINERVISIVPNPLLRVRTGRKLNNVPMNQDIYEKYFEGKNWDVFIPDEQVVFDNDTVYWCLF